MAFQMQYEDSTGVVHAASYWRVGQTIFTQAEKTGRIMFIGHASQAARLANKQPIGVKFYDISPADYDAHFAPDDLSPEGINPHVAAYEYALTVKEGAAPAEGEPDNRVSFFDGAEVV